MGFECQHAQDIDFNGEGDDAWIFRSHETLPSPTESLFTRSAIRQNRECQMSYKISGSSPNIPDGAVLLTGTAIDALKKLRSMKTRCSPNGNVHVYANGVLISEDELHLEADYEQNSEPFSH